MKKNTLSISILISMLIWGGIFMFINPDIAKLIFLFGSIISIVSFLLGLIEIRHV